MSGTPRPGQADLDKIRPSEERVYRLVGLGLTNEEIASRLYITAHTVRTHVKRLHAKLGIKGRAGLAIASHKEYWASPPHRFAAAVEILKIRSGAQLHAEAIQVLEEAGR